MSQFTELLRRLQAGDAEAREALFAAAYTELHSLAQARLRNGGRNTELDTTCLVHESYLRFVNAGELRAEDRRAFFAYASQVMRCVIVDSMRERIARKRGGVWQPLQAIDVLIARGQWGTEELLIFHDKLAVLDPVQTELAMQKLARVIDSGKMEDVILSAN